MTNDVIQIPAPGTPGFEVGRITKCFYADGTPVPDNRNDGAPLEWYDGRFWFASKEDAQAFLDDNAEYYAAKSEKHGDNGDYTTYEYVIKDGVPLFGGPF